MAIVFNTYIDLLDRKKKHNRFFTNSGTPIVSTYEYQIVDGIKMLVPNGHTNLYDSIQSYADSCDINNIVNRFLNGETDVLNVKNGQYGDFTNMPTNYAELFDRVQQCENVFNSLPVDLRDQFDNSYYKFWSDFGSSEFDHIFDEYNSKLSASPEAESKTSVSASGVESEVSNAE